MRTLSGTIPSPVAGEGFAYSFSQSEHVRLISLIAKLTTSATVANRQVAFELADVDHNIVFSNGDTTAVAASASASYVVSSAFGYAAAAMVGSASGYAVGMPDLWLPPGWYVACAVANMDAADQISGLAFVAEYGRPAWESDSNAVEWQRALTSMAKA